MTPAGFAIDNIPGSPTMRPLHDDPHPDYTAAMMADLTASGSRAEAEGGDFGLGSGGDSGEGSDGPERARERAAAAVLGSLGYVWDGHRWSCPSVACVDFGGAP